MIMTSSTESVTNGYRIGKASKLTGISADTMRIWERRYEAVNPQRSPTGGRIYTAEDIARLKLIKLLVDAGDAIGAIAGLNQKELESRLSESRDHSHTETQSGPFKMVIIGESLATKIQQAQSQLDAIELVSDYASITTFEAEKSKIEADVFVIEQATLQPETAVQITDWMNRINAGHAIVVYRYAPQHALKRLPDSRVTILRAPVEPETLQQQCIALGARKIAKLAEFTSLTSLSEPAPTSRYSIDTLSKLSMMSSTIQCECPKHLAELLTGLIAFEQYSSECESRNSKDADLHASLYKATSHARHMIENALSMVLDAEHIDI
jgi:DNA-binding transcriptional MerR regulator